MNRKFLLFLVVFVFISSVCFGLMAEESNELVQIQGKITTVDKENNVITVNGERIESSKDAIEDLFLEEGDEIVVSAQKTDKGLIAVDYNFIYEDEVVDDEQYLSDEDTEVDSNEEE